MKYISDQVGQDKDGKWFFKLMFEDAGGEGVAIEGEGFKSAHQAKIWRTKKRKEWNAKWSGESNG